jgi:carbon-monoxide dehydrogenase large subunit/6-hydroxypseudooxynicotine dehydrogenase subunit gamma
MGLKGAGEGGANAVGAAIAAAIDDALSQHNAVTELPITPLRLKRLIRRGTKWQCDSKKPNVS